MAESGLNQPLSLQGARFFVVMLECETMTKKWWVGGVLRAVQKIVQIARKQENKLWRLLLGTQKRAF
jgi:hypothetical protein